MLDWTITYGRMMERDFPRLSPTCSLAAASGALLEWGFPAAPVLGAEGKLAGLIYGRKVLQALARGVSPEQALAPFMTTNVPCVLPEERYIPGEKTSDALVVMDAGRIQGIVFIPRGKFTRVTSEYLHILEQVFFAFPSPIAGTDKRGVIRICNQAMEALAASGNCRALNSPLSTIFSDLAMPDHNTGSSGQQWQTVTHGERKFLVNQLPLNLSVRSVGSVVIFHDISEVDKISTELQTVRLLNDELDGIIEASSDGIYVTDAQGRTIRLNRAYERITGLKREDLLGYTMQEIVDMNVVDYSVTIDVLRTGKPATLIQTLHTGVTLMATGIPLHGPDGNLRLVVTTARDLTELNRLRDELNLVGSLKDQYAEELRELKQVLHTRQNVIVRSASMQTLADLAVRLGTVNSTVLIHGESGVGKEVIAELIHTNSPRRDKPFIKINCTDIPETLLESELFGYSGGAFTGANKEGKAGLFEAAQGGTLLLDEIGDLPLQLQVKLLRVLQEKQTRRIGETAPRDIDVRLLAATNQNLAEMVAQKRFREDLYYRLNVVPIYVPPLRERKEDLVLMAHTFLHRFCTLHSEPKEFHPSIMPLLLSHHWPGNVRELENVVEYMVVTSQTRVITPVHLPPSLRTLQAQPQAVVPQEGDSLKGMLHKVEAAILRDAFARHKTTRAVAKALRIGQSSVVRKAKLLGIDGV